MWIKCQFAVSFISFHALYLSLSSPNILHFLCVSLFLSFRFTTSRSSIAYRLFRSLQNGGCKRWKNDKIDARNSWNGIFNHEKLLDIIKMIGERISHPSNGISTTRFFYFFQQKYYKWPFPSKSTTKMVIFFSFLRKHVLLRNFSFNWHSVKNTSGTFVEWAGVHLHGKDTFPISTCVRCILFYSIDIIMFVMHGKLVNRNFSKNFENAESFPELSKFKTISGIFFVWRLCIVHFKNWFRYFEFHFQPVFRNI